MFVLNPDPYLRPDYKISPFRTSDIALNRRLPDDDSADTYFSARFEGKDFVYTVNGRSALYKALSHYGLKASDKVTILTTSGNTYISSCVTSEVEKFCGWNQEIAEETRVIIVVHEFGYPFDRWPELLSLGIPVIEDCAYAFFSDDAQQAIGSSGEFCVYSFPKMFPIQVGGLLTYSPGTPVQPEHWPQAGMETYIRKVMSHHLQNPDGIIQKRMSNHEWLRRELGKMGLMERFPMSTGVVPGVFMFRVSDSIDLSALRTYVSNHGIQCSIFYGEEAFFIPNHQALEESDLQYLTSVIQSFVA